MMACAPFTPLRLTSSRIGLGTWGLGGGTDWGGDGDEKDISSVIAAALDAGINLIDTAPAYGWGRAEERTGNAIKKCRNRVILADKCGIVRNESGRPDHDLRPKTVVSQCHASLRRLHTDYIDLYLIHWPDPKVPLTDVLETMERLREAGKIRAVGLCNVDGALLKQALSLTSVECVQNNLSLLHACQNEVLSICRERHIGFMAYGALGGGILSAKYKKQPNFRRADARRYFYKYYVGENFFKAQLTADRVKKVAERKKTPPSAVAEAWVLAQKGVSHVLCGARSVRQVRENAQAAGLTLTKEEMDFLEYGH